MFATNETHKIWHVHWDRSVGYKKYCSKASVDKYMPGRNAGNDAGKYGSATGWTCNPKCCCLISALQRSFPSSLWLNLLLMVKGNTWGKFAPLKTVLPMSHFYCASNEFSWEQVKIHLGQPKCQVSTWPGYVYSQLYKGMAVKTVAARDKI